jgi:signal transduction histidine kinase
VTYWTKGTAEVRHDFIVTDTGQGISRDFLPHVFERFRQADASSSRRHGGLGVGLALVHDLIELHGGSAATVRLPALDRCTPCVILRARTAFSHGNSSPD